MARVSTALLVFFTIAVVLLAGGSSGPLKDAEATTGGLPNGEVTPPVAQPVLGGGDETQPPEEPATEEPTTEEPATEEPATEEPPASPPSPSLRAQSMPDQVSPWAAATGPES